MGKTAADAVGNSLILTDMELPCVQVRPSRLTSANAPFSETLFEDATVSASDIMGPVDGGRPRTSGSCLPVPALTSWAAKGSRGRKHKLARQLLHRQF